MDTSKEKSWRSTYNLQVVGPEMVTAREMTGEATVLSKCGERPLTIDLRKTLNIPISWKEIQRITTPAEVNLPLESPEKNAGLSPPWC